MCIYDNTKLILLQLLSGMDIDLSQNSTATALKDCGTSKGETMSTMPRNTLSPPNISALLDISLTNLPAGSM